MKLFKKLMVALSVLCLVGMLAACGGGAGGTSANDKWTIVYSGEVYADDLTWADVQEGIDAMDLVSPDDYTVNQGTKTVTLTASGYAKVEAFENEMKSDMYTVIYGENVLATIPAAAIPYYEAMLIEGEDYTINESTKTITLTASGMAKTSN